MPDRCSIPADWREWRVNAANASGLALFDSVDELQWQDPKAGFDHRLSSCCVASHTAGHWKRWPAPLSSCLSYSIISAQTRSMAARKSAGGPL